MKIEKAINIQKNKNWKMVIYAKPGTGKTTLVRYLKGKTLVIDLDQSSKVLSGLKNVDIVKLNRSRIIEELNDLMKQLPALIKDNEYQNVVIDNITCFEKDWFIEMGRSSHNGISNELQDYNKWTNYFARIITSIYTLPVNVLTTAWETTQKVTTPEGQEFSQYAPEIRAAVRDGLLGLCDVVGRLVVNPKTEGRGVVLEGSDGIFAKNRLDERKLVAANELFDFGTNPKPKRASKTKSKTNKKTEETEKVGK